MVGHINCPKKGRLSKPTDMTIHWKALEEHFLMVPLVFRFNNFQVKNAFSEFFSKLMVFQDYQGKNVRPSRNITNLL
jgi:hypothetical protein